MQSAHTNHSFCRTNDGVDLVAKGLSVDHCCSVLMSAFAAYKPKAKQTQPASQPAAGEPPPKKSRQKELSGVPAGFELEEHEPKSSTGSKASLGKAALGKGSAASASATYEDLFCGSSFAGMSMPGGHNEHKQHEEQEEKVLEGEAYDYIREQCMVSLRKLKTFNDVVGVPSVVAFAHDFERAVGKGGAVRPVSGLLLFGPSGTGKSACAQAIAHYLSGTFYTFSGADLPSSTEKQAQRIDALFDVALAGARPAIIFIDEVDTLLSARATARVGHFAKAWDRFTDGLLVIGATNNPTKIAPKILTGRFERKILLGNPNPQARLALILKQLAQEDHEHLLSKEDLEHIVKQTAGRSAVNMERMVSTAVLRAGEVPVGRADFELALEEEPSDYYAKVATSNAEYNALHGWTNKQRKLPPRFFEPWEDTISAPCSDTDSDDEQ